MTSSSNTSGRILCHLSSNKGCRNTSQDESSENLFLSLGTTQSSKIVFHKKAILWFVGSNAPNISHSILFSFLFMMLMLCTDFSTSISSNTIRFGLSVCAFCISKVFIPLVFCANHLLCIFTLFVVSKFHCVFFAKSSCLTSMGNSLP